MNPPYQLTDWARDRRRGETLPLAHVINRQTLRMGEMALHNDLPAGGARLLQSAHGYLATVIGGVGTRRNDVDTGARPERLVRGGRSSGPAKSRTVEPLKVA